MASECRDIHELERAREPRRRPRSFVLWLATSSVVLSCASEAYCQQPPHSPEPSTARAPVIVDGRVLFHLAGVSAFPASERAEVFAERVRALAADPSHTPGSLTSREAGDHTQILRGETVILRIYDADARLEGLERTPVAAAIQRRIGEAVRTYREERSQAYLRARAIWSGVATALLLAWLFATRWLLRRVTTWLERRYQARVEALRVKSLDVVRAEQLWRALHQAATTSWLLVLLASLLLYVQLVFSRLPWTRATATKIVDLVLTPLSTIGAGVVNSIPDLVFLAILIAVFRYALKTARALADGLSTGAATLPGFEASWALPTYALVRLALIAFGLVVAFPYIPGSSSAAFKGVSIFVGLLVSLGSSSMIANTLAGYALIYRRVFRLGDRVQIGSVVGDVIATGLQVTHLKTPKNEEVVVPNSTILNSEVTNFSALEKSHGLILHTTVGIGYGTPWRQVEAILLLAASRTPGVLKDPAPFVRQKALGEFFVTYELNAYCSNALAMNAVYTDMHRQMLDAFNEFGVQIMTPAYEGDTQEPKVVQKGQWHAAPAVEAPASTGEPSRGFEKSEDAGTMSEERWS